MVATVGVTFGHMENGYSGLHRGYIEGLAAAGAAVQVWPGENVNISGVGSAAKEMVAGVDAVVLTGGGDVNPARYGEESVSGRNYGIDDVRDAFEIAVVHEAMSQGKRILAICRGLQVANVALGGTLYQDVETAGFADHSRRDVEYDFAHEVTSPAGSLVARIFGEAFPVNSLHHQAVKVLANGLVPTATSSDGLVEAFEAGGLVGIQWHPERLLARDPRSSALFEWVVG